MNFAIPVDRLMKMLKEPLLSVLPSTLDYAKRGDTQALLVKVVSLIKPTPVYTVELTLKAGNFPPRVMTAQSLNGVCKFNTSLAPPAGKSAADLIVTGTFADGAITGHTLDRPFYVNSQKVMLAAVHELHFNPDGQAAVSTGQQTFTGALHDLDGIALTVGGSALRPNWTRVISLTVASADQPVRSIQYTLKTLANGETVAQTTGTFDLSGDVPEAAPVVAAPLALWPMIRDGIANHRMTQTSEHGGMFSMKEPYSDIPKEGGLLIGFNYSMGTWVNRPIVSSLQPIYLTEHGRRFGPVEGQENYPVKRIEAKSGYVISGVHIHGGGNLEGFGIVFTRLNGTTLDPTDSYESEWVGVTDGGSSQSIDTSGGMPVGISGKKAEKIGSLALVVLPMEAGGPSAPVPVRPDDPNKAPMTPAPTTPPILPGLPVAEAPIQPHVAGQPYRSFEQMFETLPASLQPSNGTWIVGRRVSPELTERLRDQPAELSGEFASFHSLGDEVEVMLDSDPINYHGIRLTGQIRARFPQSELARLQALTVHQRVTVAGKIDQMVVRGSGFDTSFLWLKECRLVGG